MDDTSYAFEKCAASYYPDIATLRCNTDLEYVHLDFELADSSTFELHYSSRSKSTSVKTTFNNIIWSIDKQKIECLADVMLMNCNYYRDDFRRPITFDECVSIFSTIMRTAYHQSKLDYGESLALSIKSYPVLARDGITDKIKIDPFSFTNWKNGSVPSDILIRAYAKSLIGESL